MGHVVEALKVARGIVAATDGLRVSIAVNASAPFEVARYCTWLDQCFAVEVQDWSDAWLLPRLSDTLPLEWTYVLDVDWILFDLAGRNRPDRDEQGILNFHHATRQGLSVRTSHGTLFPYQHPDVLMKWDHPELMVPYDPEARLRFDLNVERDCRENGQFHPEKRDFCIMLAGSGPTFLYPSEHSWVEILTALHDSFPNARFFLTGVSNGRRGGTTTQGFNSGDVTRISRRVPGVIDAYDIGLDNQLKLLARCGTFVSPHTGFGFLASCVGTPWLTLSGGNWPEYFFDGVPFYSVLPDNPDYPYKGTAEQHVSSGRIPCMQPEALRRKLPEMVEAAMLLRSSAFTYREALELHRVKVNQSPCRRDLIPTVPRF